MRRSKFLILLAALITVISQGTALDVSTGSSCDELENFISLNDTQGGHVGEPGYYSNQICVEVDETDIKQSCGEDEETLFSMEGLNNSHISIFEDKYDYKMCSEGIDANIASSTSCVNGTKAASVAEKDNTHVAYPSYTSDPYNQSLCLTTREPTEVTVKMEGVSGNIYSDDQQLSVGEELSSPLDYPYIVNDQPLGIVSNGEFVKLKRRDTDTISMTQEEGGFLIPFTTGGYIEIDEEGEDVRNNQFLGRPLASFAGPDRNKQRVRVIYDFENKVEIERDNIINNGQIAIRNSGLDDNLDPVIQIR